MKRRTFIRNTGLAIPAAYLPLTTCTTKRKKPNILFIMTDQWRGDCIGAEGSRWIHTPNLDQLAAEGALFNKAYTSLPSCLPARASLLTGMSPWGHGLLLYAPMAEDYPWTKPRLLRDAGYYTIGIGKMHYHTRAGRKDYDYDKLLLEEGWTKEDDPFKRYFRENAPGEDMNASGLTYTDHRTRPYPFEEQLHPTYWTAQESIDFLERYNRDQPYFLKVSFHRPHPPFDPPQRWLDYYKKADLPEATSSDWADKKYGHLDTIPPADKPQTQPRGNFGAEIIRESREGYYAAMSFIDEQIGRLLQALGKRGDLENTLILFTSDHGDMMGDHHLWRKTYAYEGSARVPMIIRWPASMRIDAVRGQTISKLVELRDVLPTFLDTAAHKGPDALEGASMLDLIRGNDQNWRRVLDLEHGTCYWPENNWTALTDGRYKYIYFATDGEQQLFDLDKDPNEERILSADPDKTDLLQEWRRRMIDHLSVRGEPWVVSGDLGIRKDPIHTGTNYPRS